MASVSGGIKTCTGGAGGWEGTKKIVHAGKNLWHPQPRDISWLYHCPVFRRYPQVHVRRHG